MVRFLLTVQVRPTPAMVKILSALDAASRALGLDIVVTSGAEPQVPPRASTDPHTTGEAFDVRVKDYSPEETLQLYHFLIGAVEASEITVLFEGPMRAENPALAAIQFVNPQATGFHFHVQRKKGMVLQ